MNTVGQVERANQNHVYCKTSAEDVVLSYTLAEHQHRLAAWAASTAASASPLCRFRVESGFRILEEAGFDKTLSMATQTENQLIFDGWHDEKRQVVIDTAARNGCCFSHGIAAKLINCYLKVRFVCGPTDGTVNTAVIHPPIDSLLLKALAKTNIGELQHEWRYYDSLRWSKFSSEQYRQVIALIQGCLGTQPLWKIEKYWDGHAAGANNE